MTQDLPRPNPYDVLEISPEASNQEITLAFTMAMKRRKYSLNVIAIARKSLINRQERIIADYLRPHIPLVQRFKRTDLSGLNTSQTDLEFLAQFNSIEQNQANVDGITIADQQLGRLLFSDFPD